MATASATSTEIIDLFKRYVVPNYVRYPICLVRGEGSYVWDAEGTRYLDFFPGWGCNLLGHCPEPVVKAVQEQVATLIHVPNTWYTEAQGQWAKALSEAQLWRSGIFLQFRHGSERGGHQAGATAHAARAIQDHHLRRGLSRPDAGSDGSHGAAEIPRGAWPADGWFQLRAVWRSGRRARKIDGETAAIMVEPVQGEGGINLPPPGFLQGLRKLCDDNGLLLIFDEVQAGFGRTGKWFAYQNFDVTPDVMTLAKALCGGVAGGAMLTTAEIAPSLRPGMHAATFGGNPIAARAGIAAIEMIENEHLLEHGLEISKIFRAAARSSFATNATWYATCACWA